MKKQLQQVAEFHNKVKAPVLRSPSFISKERSNFRYALMNEEVHEYLEVAIQKQDMPDLAKELVDVLYTVYGTILEHGLQEKIEQVFDEVHRSNMTKDASSGKAVKGEGYEPANIKKFFE